MKTRKLRQDLERSLGAEQKKAWMMPDGSLVPAPDDAITGHRIPETREQLAARIRQDLERALSGKPLPPFDSEEGKKLRAAVEQRMAIDRSRAEESARWWENYLRRKP